MLTSDNLSDDNDNTPIDHNNLIYINMFLQGIGMLFAWNAFITAVDYFHYRLCDTVYANNFENFFSFVYCGANLLTLLYLTRYQNLYSLHKRFIFPLTLQSLVFTIMTLFVFYTNINPYVFLDYFNVSIF